MKGEFEQNTNGAGEGGREGLRLLFKEAFGVEPEVFEPLPRSGSSRRYFRLSGGGAGCIGSVGKNVAENEAFVYLARHFRGRGLNVPEVYSVSADRKLYLQQDLGSVSLFDAVAGGRTAGAYSTAEEELLCGAIAKLPEIQFSGAVGLDFDRCHPVPRMSGRSVMFDLNYFKYCYLLPSGLEYNELYLQEEFEKLAADLPGEKFDTFMYRDFQTRNVMLCGGEPYFIDFQGGRCGPVYYDVASFVWQARSRFPSALKERLVDTYLAALDGYRHVGRDEFLSRLRVFLLFRIMQVLGAYGFRGLYQRKPHFIESIPFALANLRELLSVPFGSYPYLSGLLSDLADMGAGVEGRAEPSQGPEPHQAGRSVPCPGPDGAGEKRLTVSLTSFSYKSGIPQDPSGNGGGYVFDCRGLNNPGRYERYRNSTGRDADVIGFLEEDGGVFGFLDGVYAMVDPHVENFISRSFTSLCVNFGCTGGRHRSVYCAEALAGHLARKFPSVDIVLRHTGLGTGRTISHRS